MIIASTKRDINVAFSYFEHGVVKPIQMFTQGFFFIIKHSHVFPCLENLYIEEPFKNVAITLFVGHYFCITK